MFHEWTSESILFKLRNTLFFKFKSTKVNLLSSLICGWDRAAAPGHAHIDLAYFFVKLYNQALCERSIKTCYSVVENQEILYFNVKKIFKWIER